MASEPNSEPLRVMLVEDEEDIRENISALLSGEGMKVTALENGENIMETIRKERPDIVLLDQKLPGRQGIELLQQIRSNKEFQKLPVVMVTGLSGEEETVRALEFGADDYITKPFAARVLSLKVRAVATRGWVNKTNLKVIKKGPLRIDPASYKVFLKEQEIPLTLTEFKILAELLKEDGQVMTRENLCQKVLGHSNVSSRTIDVHMSSLRKKLNDGDPIIETVRGVGYRLACG